MKFTELLNKWDINSTKILNIVQLHDGLTHVESFARHEETSEKLPLEIDINILSNDTLDFDDCHITKLPKMIAVKQGSLCLDFDNLEKLLIESKCTILAPIVDLRSCKLICDKADVERLVEITKSNSTKAFIKIGNELSEKFPYVKFVPQYEWENVEYNRFKNFELCVKIYNNIFGLS